VTVVAPAGFRAAGVAAGLKSAGPDVALVVNDGPRFDAAGVFTANRVKAAPVLWSQAVLAGQRLRAVVLNSGGANACTGPAGFQDTHATAEHLAGLLGTGAGEVAVCSTGLIGERLPMDRLLAGVSAAAAALAADTPAGSASAPTPADRDGGGGRAAAEAIMTTDTRPKTVVVRGDGWSVGGMAKGAGMLSPALATMLCVLTTDAVADAADLDAALRAATRVTFDRLDSDGCLSTNDTVLLLASGASGVAPSPSALSAAVTDACRELVLQLRADAEGATKEVTIEVVGAAGEDEAVTVGRAIARNNLVKTALFGNDPNWGRILAAVGTTDAVFAPDELDVAVNGVWVCKAGAAAEDRSTVDLSGRAVTITVDLHAGTESAIVWTTDLSHGYVHENSAYST
jgi:glutamate N-acetyltransferase / amino-acid N-acetyltransferase